METVKKHFFSDMSVMLGRSMRHIFRSMDTIITVCITPIAMLLLFVYVLGGAIQTGTDNYVNYLLPGILLIAIASGIAYTSYRLFMAGRAECRHHGDRKDRLHHPCGCRGGAPSGL